MYTMQGVQFDVAVVTNGMKYDDIIVAGMIAKRNERVVGMDQRSSYNNI